MPLPPPGPERYRRLQRVPVADLVEELREAGAEAAGGEWDLSDPDTSARLLDDAEEALGPVGVLVNNAAHWEEDSFRPGGESSAAAGEAGGPSAPSPLTAASHDRHFAVNSRAPALLTAELARRLRERDAPGGRIVNISTDAAAGHAGSASYGASKSALESYSRAAAWELGPEGITVNVVSPGPVQTGWIGPELEEALLEEIPLRRIGSPEEVADAVVFLGSRQARWITGQVLYVGGGHVMPL